MLRRRAVTCASRETTVRDEAGFLELYSLLRQQKQQARRVGKAWSGDGGGGSEVLA
jgi:hypothetical protein